MDKPTHSVATFIVLVVMVFIVFYLFYRLFSGGQVVTAGEVIDFTERTNEKITVNLGQSTEGYTPSMFLKVYPGIIETDFNNVEGQVGRYVYEEGELYYDQRGEKELHSISRSISSKGMKTLLGNIALRKQISESDPQLVDKVIAVIEAPRDSISSGNGSVSTSTSSVIGLPVILTGVIECLSYKDEEDSQALECVLGLHTEDGSCYGLRNLFETSGAYFDVGQKIKVTGTLYAPESNNMYDINGVIDVAHAEKI